MHQMELRSLEPLNDPTSPLYDPTTFQARVKDALAELDEHQFLAAAGVGQGVGAHAQQRGRVDVERDQVGPAGLEVGHLTDAIFSTARSTTARETSTPSAKSPIFGIA